MRKVNRLEKPAILQKHEKKWVKKIQLALQSGTEKDLELATNKYQHKEIKSQLLKMFLGRCAYCENKYEPSDFGDIEHFRPRSKFRLLAVKWNNLLLSCRRCNGKETKGNKFPNPKLINPCRDNPEEHFLFDYDETLEIANVFGITPRGLTTEITLQLNREGLRRDRSVYIKKLIVLAQYYHQNNKAKELLNMALNENNPDAEYLAFAKFIKQKITNPIN
jgi:uncharacterized protein (TIGR02646 family)